MKKRHLLKFVFVVYIILISEICTSQSVFKSNYNNKGSYTIDLGYSKYGRTPFDIYSLRADWRLLYFNLGCDFAIGTEKTQNPYPAYISGFLGVAIPLFHQKYATSTLNINAVAYNFEEGQSIQLSGYGWELYGKYNTTFGNIKFGYSKAPDIELQFFDLNGFFIRAGLGFNKFKTHKSSKSVGGKAYSFKNSVSGNMNDSVSKKELKELLLSKLPHLN